MAEAVLLNIVANIIGNLSSSLILKFALKWGAKKEFQRLRDNIRDIQFVVVDAERRQHGSEAVKRWLASLQEVIYDVQDLVEEISAEAKRQELTLHSRLKVAKAVRVFFSYSSNPLLFRLKFAERITETREKLDELKSSMGIFNFLPRDAKEEVFFNKREETISFVKTDDIIGRDDDKNAIMNMLVKVDESQGNPSVISIVGIGGLGKTTLAQLVYNDKIVQQTFEPKMWVCVSENFDVQDIARKIGFDDNKDHGFANVLTKLKEKYEKKRYLIVLDDVWNEDPEEWRRLKAILPAGASGSTIIVTTRSKAVANIMRSSVPMYELKGLSPDQSWTLFKKLTEEPELESNLQLARIGRQIIRKCANVPLAIRTLGSLLCGKDVVEWSFINDHDLANIEQDDQDILPVLRISYNYLPSHLKHCFCFCAIFPKDYTFRKESLVNMWITAGFIPPANVNQSLEDIGEIAFLFLLRRCFFQDLERNDSGEIKSFKMHDLIHDLAQLVAGNQAACIEYSNPKFSQEEAIRYVNFNISLNSTLEIPSPLLRAKKLRVFTQNSSVDVSGSTFNNFSSSFQFLRVVNLRKLGLKKFPSSIAKLKLLRFLDLSYNDHLKYLPSSLVSLVNLQILDLYHCESLHQLPRNFKNLISLRCLNIMCCYSLTRKLTELAKLNFLFHSRFRLTRISHDSDYTWKDFPSFLTLVGHVEDGQSITPLLHVKMDLSVFAQSKKFPVSVELWEVKHYNHTEMPSWGIRLDEFASPLSKLSEIRFAHCTNLRHLPIFCQLPSLKILILQHMQYVDYIEDSNNANSTSPSSSVTAAASGTFFPCLEEFELSHLFRLKAWSPQVEATMGNDGQNRHLLPSFPRLSVLSIKDCPNLKSMPLIPNVKSSDLHLKNVSEILSQTLKTQGTGQQQQGL